MPVQYLLPCEHCNHTFDIVATQAGQSLQCPECQQQTTVPTLGELKKLKQVDSRGASNTSSAAPGGRPQRMKSVLFATGLLLAVVAGIAGLTLFLYSRTLYTDFALESSLNQLTDQLDTLEPAALLELYRGQAAQTQSGLGEWRELPFVRYNKQATILANFAYGLFAIAGLGLVAMLSSFFIRQAD